VAKREGQGEACGVDGPAGPICGGTGADEVVPVCVGEEPVAPVAGGGPPRVDGEGEPPRHVYRHPPLPKLSKNYGQVLRSSGSRAPASGANRVGVFLEGNRVELAASVYMRAERGGRLLPPEGRGPG
jgi:hypothetical protein